MFGKLDINYTLLKYIVYENIFYFKMSLYFKIMFISVDNNQMLYRVLQWSDLEWSGSPWKAIFRFLLSWRYSLDSMWLPLDTVECMPILIIPFQFWWREIVTFSFINTFPQSNPIIPSQNMTAWAIFHPGNAILLVQGPRAKISR